MSGSGKAGSGSGNSRRRSARRRDKDNNNRHGGNDSHGTGAYENGNSRGDSQKARGRAGLGGENRPGRNPAGPENQGRHNPSALPKRGGDNYRRDKAPFFDRPKWVPPKISTEPLPVPDCPWCGKPIRDISLAIADKDSGAPVHFECVATRIAGGEILEKGDVVTYIGGGRFGIVYFSGSGNSQPSRRDFKIKKIIEWENKDKRAEWRSLICDRYSIT